MNIAVIAHRLKTNKGFILAEVMLAMVIMSVALLAISGMFTQALQADMLAHHYTVAANLAQQQLELLKTQPPGYWAGLSLPAVIPWSNQEQLPASRYTVVTNAVAATAADSLVEVRVIVSWQERGTECKVEFATLYPAL